MISAKSKAIKKARPQSDIKKFEESLRFVKEKDGKFSVKKLRGKTLDLTEMGLLKKKLDIHVEVKAIKTKKVVTQKTKAISKKKDQEKKIEAKAEQKIQNRKKLRRSLSKPKEDLQPTG